MPRRKEPPAPAFAAWLTDFMQVRGLTDREVGRALDVGFTTVIAWRQGGAKPSVVPLLRLADYAGVDVDGLSRLLLADAEPSAPKPAVTWVPLLETPAVEGPVRAGETLPYSPERVVGERPRQRAVAGRDARRQFAAWRLGADGPGPIRCGDIVIADTLATPSAGDLVVVERDGLAVARRIGPEDGKRPAALGVVLELRRQRADLGRP